MTSSARVGGRAQACGGTYRFPTRYLVESSAGYWVSGAYMRLEENRRRRQSLTLDSTFRLLSIGKHES